MLILLLISALILTISFLLYRWSVQRGGIDAVNFGNHLGDRHWQNLNRYEGEEDDGRKLR